MTTQPRYNINGHIMHFYGDYPLVHSEIPPHITNLSIHSNQPLTPESIPPTIKTITFYSDYDQVICPNHIPSTVITLLFQEISKPILEPGSIPSSINNLIILNLSINLAPLIIPNSVIDFTCETTSESILVYVPPSVKYLTCNVPLICSLRKNQTSLRASKLCLKLNNDHLKSEYIPPSITSLQLYDDFNGCLTPKIIPDNIILLKFNNKFNQQLVPGSMSSNLKNLYFGHDYNQPLLPGSIPESVKKLYFGHNFDKNLPHILPRFDYGHSFLRVLYFCYKFNQPLTQLLVPHTLTHLTVCEQFNNIVSINPNTKITCTISNYKLFIQNKSRSIRILFLPGEQHEIFSENHLINGDDVYTITSKKINDYRWVILRLNITKTKSARKV